MVAYTYARLYPGERRGLMILDVSLPGIESWEEIKDTKQSMQSGTSQMRNAEAFFVSYTVANLTAILRFLQEGRLVRKPRWPMSSHCGPPDVRKVAKKISSLPHTYASVCRRSHIRKSSQAL
jgi:hypothetical protein